MTYTRVDGKAMRMTILSLISLPSSSLRCPTVRLLHLSDAKASMAKEAGRAKARERENGVRGMAAPMARGMGNPHHEDVMTSDALIAEERVMP